MKNKAVFLDRDGVLNRELGDYVCRVEDFHVLEHNFKPLKQLQDRGYILIVITNQGGGCKRLVYPRGSGCDAQPSDGIL